METEVFWFPRWFWQEKFYSNSGEDVFVVIGVQWGSVLTEYQLWTYGARGLFHMGDLLIFITLQGSYYHFQTTNEEIEMLRN